ncbi:hypothetical protein ACSN7O_004797 [Enterobacter chuandaensis]
MNMMQKMSLLALAVCAAGAVSTVARADDKSWGTASAKVTVNAAQEWKIEKVKDGIINLEKDNHYTNYSDNVTKMGGVNTTFKITNGTQTAGKYYITGSGDSASSDGSIYMVKDDDATTKIKLKPYMGDGTQYFEWVNDANKYRTRTDVAANGTQEFTIAPIGDQTLTPGSYTMTLELFTPAA